MLELDRGICEILSACDEDDYALWEIASVYRSHAAAPLTPALIEAMVKQGWVELIDLQTGETLEGVTLKEADFSSADPREVRLRLTDAGRHMYDSDSCRKFLSDDS